MESESRLMDYGNRLGVLMKPFSSQNGFEEFGLFFFWFLIFFSLENSHPSAADDDGDETCIYWKKAAECRDYARGALFEKRIDVGRQLGKALDGEKERERDFSCLSGAA